MSAPGSASDWVVVRTLRVFLSALDGEELREVEYSAAPASRAVRLGEVVSDTMTRARARRKAERMQAASDVLET